MWKFNQTETKYIKQGGTWFNQECWMMNKIDSNPKLVIQIIQPKPAEPNRRLGYLDNRMKNAHKVLIDGNTTEKNYGVS